MRKRILGLALAASIGITTVIPAHAETMMHPTAVWNALNRPIYRNDAGYRSAHDRDNDGVGCETDPR